MGKGQVKRVSEDEAEKEDLRTLAGRLRELGREINY